MVAHSFPCAGVADSFIGHGFGHAGTAASSGPAAAVPNPGKPGRVNQGRHGPLRVPIHVASGRQGAGLDPGRLPRGAGPRRLRGPLLLSDAGPARARCRRQCAAGGDRGADRAVSALFGAARAILRVALRHQRDTEDRRRGQGGAHRSPQVACRYRRRGRVRRSRSQVSDLGARALPRRTRGGHREGSRAQAAIGSRVAADRGARE